MEQFFTTQDLQAINYIPKDKLENLVQDLDRIIKTKVAGTNDKVWTTFLADHAVGKPAAGRVN